MKDKDVRPATEGATKQKRYEEAQGRKEVCIRPEKCAHSPTVSQRTHNPEGFYSEDWNEDQQEEDKWQAPDKGQRISQMVFCGGCLDINPVGYRSISSSYTQHQRGGFRVSEK